MEPVSTCKEQLAKRTRTPNYTTLEKVTLLEIVGRYKNIIENKKTNSVTWREKDGAWAKVATEFNARTPAGVFRDKDSLRKCYENNKKGVRKALAADKRNIRKTGGGAYESEFKSDVVSDMVLEIANPKTLVGLSNEFDGDAQTFQTMDRNEAEEVDMSETFYITNDEDDELPDVLSENRAEARMGATADTNVGIGDIATQEKENWAVYKPNDLKTPLSNKLSRNEKWTNRRRPKVIEPVHTNFISQQYSEVATLKKKYLEEVIEIAKAKEKREVEESQMRKRALALDISIKEMQLKRLKNSFD